MSLSLLSLLLLVLLLACSTQATHFLGTVMTYYPKNTNANGSVTVAVRYKNNFHSCGYLRLRCLSGDCGTESLLVRDIDMESGEWCQKEGISTRLVPSNALFQLGIDGGDWINSIVNGIKSWRAVTLVELRNRSDTGQANRSPQTTILPAVRVPSNCQRDFDLLMFDPDGDEVKCRYGNTSLSECNPCTPPSVLNLSSSCTLSFSPNSSSNEGPYAVQLVMEDFPRQTINLTQSDGALTTITTNDSISKIPIQFVLRVDPVVPSCTEGLYLPKFLPPTPNNRARLYTSVNQTLEIVVNAEANTSTISELLFSGPYNTSQSTSGPGQFILSWTPSVDENGESHPICFVIQAVNNGNKYHSDLRCVIVSVENTTVTTTSATTTRSTTTIPSTTTQLTSTTSTTTTTTTAGPTTPETTITTPTVTPTQITTVASTTTPTATTSTQSPTICPTSMECPVNLSNNHEIVVLFANINTANVKNKYHLELRCVIVSIGNDLTNNTTASTHSTATVTTTPTTTTRSTTTVPSTTTQLTSTTSTTTTTTTTPPTTPETTVTTPAVTPTQSTTVTSTTTPMATTSTQSPTISTVTTTPTTTTQSTTTSPSTMTQLTSTTSTTRTTTTTPPTTPQTTITTPAVTPTQITTVTSTTTPMATTSAQSPPTYVVGLTVRVSSLFPLSEEYINNIIQQLKNQGVTYGLPADFSLRLVKVMSV